jgi:FtsP/CotA-like multicopper oxidase with cupredoxin domain
MLIQVSPLATMGFVLGSLLSAAPVTRGYPRVASAALPLVHPNANTERAGVLRGSILAVSLEAKRALLPLNGPSQPAMTIEAFAEPGKTPQMPGPLLRTRVGTELRLSIRNSLATPLTFLIPTTLHGGADRFDAMDSIVVAHGATGVLTTRPTAPGNYIYRATTPAGAKRFTHLTGILAGALVIDSAGATTAPHDRVFVVMGTPDSASSAYDDTVALSDFRAGKERDVFTINGRSWPDDERVYANVGDSLHWRVISASWQPHPMHLHGFYYRVDDFSGPETDEYGRPSRGAMVVTAFMSGFSTMSMTWSPDRPGNWLFHCHFAVHVRPDSILAMRDDPHERMMVGLALGTTVTARPGVVAAGEPATGRQLRLVAEVQHPERITPHALDRAARTADSVPTMRFVLDEHGHPVDSHTDMSPELDLVRGEPVSITIVNHLPEPTSVHWHGIEVQASYADGVPGFSGDDRRLTPEIAPGDSFVARFTPPRAGTFMYHAHIDEIRQQLAGLEGALIVRDPAARSSDDHSFFFKEEGSARRRPQPAINGQAHPDTVVLHVGRPARLRLLDLSTNWFASTFVLARTRDSTAALPSDELLERWRPVAKDGFDLSPTRRVMPARQVISIGETYDFAYTPSKTGWLQLEVWRLAPLEVGLPPKLLITVPIRVE